MHYDLVTLIYISCSSDSYNLNRFVCVPTTYEPRHVTSNNVVFLHVSTQTSLCSLLLSLETPNDVHSVAQHSYNMQATSKGSDQTARMRRLI